MLSSGFVLEAGVCSVKWMRDFHHRNKKKIASNTKMAKNVAHIDDLSKQKVPPALALFTREITMALEDEHKDSASGTSIIFEND